MPVASVARRILNKDIKIFIQKWNYERIWGRVKSVLRFRDINWQCGNRIDRPHNTGVVNVEVEDTNLMQLLTQSGKSGENQRDQFRCNTNCITPFSTKKSRFNSSSTSAELLDYLLLENIPGSIQDLLQDFLASKKGVRRGWLVDVFVCLTVWTSFLGKDIHILLFLPHVLEFVEPMNFAAYIWRSSGVWLSTLLQVLLHAAHGTARPRAESLST